MRNAFLLTCSAVVLLELGCCTSKTSEKPQTVIPAPPNVIQQNIATVEGVVDSVTLAGPHDYQLSMYIRSSGTQANGFAAQGEHLSASPRFLLDASGAVDTADARNTGLLKLRAAKAGEVLRAKISLNAEGKWMILELLDH